MNRNIESVEADERDVIYRLDELTKKKKQFFKHQTDKDYIFGDINHLLRDLYFLPLDSKDSEEAIEIQLEYQELERIVASAYEKYETNLKKEERLLESRIDELYQEKRRLRIEELNKKEQIERANKNG